MKRLWWLLLPLTLAACGGGTKTVTAPPAPPDAPAAATAPQTHPCTGNDYYMQCAANAPGQIPLGNFLLTPFARFGIDFAYGGPSGGTSHSRGAGFGASYVSDSSKDWTYSNLHSYVNSGLGAVLVWEQSAARSLDGWNAGYDDAFTASQEAARLGYPKAHIDFASDYDTSVYGTRFLAYYQGAAAWGKRNGSTTGAYGGYHTISVVCAYNAGTLNWQTLAWSYGQWLNTGCAPLRQTSINDDWYGSSVDFDLAVSANYGQVNAAPPPPPPPSKAQVASWERARDASYAAYHANCSNPTGGFCDTFVQRVLYFQGQLDRVQARPHCWIRFRGPGPTVCQLVRPLVAYWSSAHAATVRARNATKNPAARRTLATRATYFQNKVNSTLSAWA